MKKIKEEYCKECWEQIKRKDKEGKKDFLKRKFCNNSCSAKYRMKNISLETKEKLRNSHK